MAGNVVTTAERASTPSADRRTIPVNMKATRQHADPMEGLWLGMFLCVPFWAALLALVR
jgi:hypothetical protein